MRKQFITIGCVAFVGLAGLLSMPAMAQQKTVKVCQDEWRANRAANQAKGVTEKAYVDKCRTVGATTAPATPAPAAPAPAARTPAAPAPASPVMAQQKTVKACTDEWRANRAANQAKGVTEKAYVDKCRTATTAPAAPAAAAPAAPAPAPAAATPTRPAPITSTKSAPTTAATPTGAGQYATVVEAKARCLADTVVWVNLRSKIYHYSKSKDYGTTKRGAYMCEKDTAAAGFRAAKNEKRT